jgi:serine/threonine protein kinase
LSYASAQLFFVQLFFIQLFSVKPFKVFMQASSIPSGSVLRDRYLVKAAIAQGGMGRTYVAEDLERFQELCVLKEFILTDPSPQVVAKAKELFQREASILYQIRHPQIPEFRATFEMGGRLFLVQDFVEGKTFRELLNERLSQGKVFNEAEVRQLLWQILPVLAYLHSRQIIHRDISPENLMQRSLDGLPVLIDFGVGKEAATQIRNSHVSGTMVGKLGYAPSEQMQTGRAYASSDLYALAVTVIVLLTGREPQDMYDDRHLNWTWQGYTQVSGGFAKILDRMLSNKPAQRFSQAEEVLEALQLLQAAALDQKTIAVVRAGNNSIPPQTAYVGNNYNTAPPVKNQARGINWFLGIFLAIAAASGSWLVTSGLLKQLAMPTSNNPEAKPKPVNLVNVTKTIEFADRSDKATVSDRLVVGQMVTYQLTAKKGQTMTVRLEGTGLQMTLNYEDLKPIDSTSSKVEIGYWRGKLPASGAYFILIQPQPGVNESSYNLEVQIESPPPPLPPIPSPVPTPDPIPLPTPTPTPSPLPSPSPTPLPTPDPIPLPLPTPDPVIPPTNTP